ncbi:MAG: helix-turn-helix transcriptional regulator [Deltaproteobacteria bacterium]|nr:helix-turn-helix transcriptional regulator [Deltaproteobacteria bacterium]
MRTLASDRNRLHIFVGGTVHRYKDIPLDQLKTVMGQLVAYEIPFEQLPEGNYHDHRIARTVRMLRHSRFLTQSQLAALAQIPQSHISEIERSKRVVGRKLAQRLAAALKTDYRTLL